MPAARSSALFAALACAVFAAHDAAAQGAPGGGTNQLATQDTPGTEAAKVNKVDALTIKQGAAAEGAAQKAAGGAAKQGALKLNPLEDAAIKRGSGPAHKDAAAIKGESGLAHKDAAAIKGESSKDGTTGILIGLTPKPEADASMAGDASKAAARVRTMDQQQKAAGVIAPIDHKARAVTPGDYKPLTPSTMPSVGTAQAVPQAAPAQSALPAVQSPALPAVQSPAIKQATPAMPGGTVGGAPAVIKK